MSNEDKLSAAEVDKLGVTEAWANLILFVRRKVPFGTVSFRTQKGQPTKIDKWEPEYRCDKGETMPLE